MSLKNADGRPWNEFWKDRIPIKKKKKKTDISICFAFQ